MIDGGLRPIFRNKLKRGFHWQSVETGGTGLGVPDSNYCSEGVEGWVEFKLTGAFSVGLRPEQIGWLVMRAKRGGRVFIATRRKHEGGPRKGEPIDELWLHEGQYARELKHDGLLADVPRTVMGGGPTNWDWDLVRRVLLGTGLGA